MEVGMTKFWLISLFSIILISCNFKSDDKNEGDQAVFDAIDPILPVKEATLDSLSLTDNGTDYLFVVDADCSICVSVLFSEIEEVDSKNVSKFFIVGPDSSGPLIRHYIHEVSPEILNRVVILNGNEVLTDPLYRYNGNFYKIVNGKCEAAWCYSGVE